ncbi:MAG: DNA-directed RNA polymerase subunit alpha C-terminal domain-containing protein [Patescibacteria group bacterium]
MTLTIAQIRLLAVYFVNSQLAALFGITSTDIETAFAGEPIPTSNLLALPHDLERLERFDQAAAEATALAKSGGITEEQITQMSHRLTPLNLSASARTFNCLTESQMTIYRPLGLIYIWQVCEMTEGQLLKTKMFGRKSLNDIKELLSEIGLHIGMDLSKIKDRLPQPPK